MGYSEADRANDRYESRTVWQKVKRWCNALPRRVRTYGPDVLGTVGVIGVMAWEWRNAALGFDQLFRPGIWWASIVGAAVCMTSLWFHRVAMEAGRANKFYQALTFGVLAFATACVVWVGVWSNLAADSLNAGEHKIEQRAERETLLTQVRVLERRLLTMPEPIGLEADRIALESLLITGKQWGLGKLEAADCDKTLDATRRAMCVDAGELRGDVATSEAMVAAKQQVQDDLNKANGKLATFVESSGAEHFEEMAGMFGHREQWKLVSNFVILAISIILYVAACFGNDYLAERRERKPEAIA